MCMGDGFVSPMLHTNVFNQSVSADFTEISYLSAS